MAVNFSKLFFFRTQIQKIIFEPFWWVIAMLLIFYIPFLRVWWWVFAPFFLAVELRTLYLWWMNWDYYEANVKWVVLEITPPKQILIPLKAMEDVFNTLWAPIYNVPNWRERWCEGVPPYVPGWMSFEIASIEGSLHFYARVPADLRTTVETALYSHYPELEIAEVQDYVKIVPQNIPSQEWDVYGEDFVQVKPAAFPIKTYEAFFEPQGDKVVTEEKRIDPIASLLELMSKIGPGEHYWIQFIFGSVEDDLEPEFARSSKKIVAKLARRAEKKTTTFYEEFMNVMQNLILGPVKVGSGEKASLQWRDAKKAEDPKGELLLTPGEGTILQAVETKLKKPMYRTYARAVYVAKRDNWRAGHKTLARSYFAHFQTSDLNLLKFSTVTRPKTHYIFRKRIPYLRSRRQFRNYISRMAPLFPERKKESMIFNTEELATVFHFPIRVTGLVFPTMSRVESKKSGPPPNLPTE